MYNHRGNDNYLLVKLEDGVYAMGINKVKEVLSLKTDHIRRFNSKLSHVVVVAKVRDSVVSLIDLSKLVDEKSIQQEGGNKEVKILTVTSNEEHARLIVKDELDVCKFPHHFIGKVLDYIIGVHILYDELIFILDVDKLLSNDRLRL